jgi:hypothetical protein
MIKSITAVLALFALTEAAVRRPDRKKDRVYDLDNPRVERYVERRGIKLSSSQEDEIKFDEPLCSGYTCILQTVPENCVDTAQLKSYEGEDYSSFKYKLK